MTKGTSSSNNGVAALLSQTALLCKQGRIKEALLIYQQILTIEPDNFDALLGVGMLHEQSGSFEEALQFLSKANASKPNNFDVYFNLGKAFQGLKRYDQALASYDEALTIKPGDAYIYNSRGIVYKELKCYEDALSNCERAIALKPDFAEAYCNRGNALGNLRRFEEALESYERAISLSPDFSEAYYKQGLALQCVERYEDAINSYDMAISLEADRAEIHNDRGIALQRLNQHEEALSSYNVAISLKPDYAEAYYNRGIALQGLKRHSEALDSYGRAISFKPDFVDAFNNSALALQEMGRYEQALACYDRALSIMPDYAKAYVNRGLTFVVLKRYEDALDNFNKAITIDPQFPYVYGYRLQASMRLGLWNDFERRVKVINELTESGFLASNPFSLMSLPSAPKTVLKCASLHVADKYLPACRVLWQGESYNHNRIRIGYFSADFDSHPIAHLLVDLIEKHDRSRFEIFAFSFDAENQKDVGPRLIKAFDQFIDVSSQNDQATAALARNLEVDIAVDLMGFTQDARLGIFAQRFAPIQVSFLGYPGTLGAPFMDYIIADPVVIPKEHFENYMEKVVHLPYSYQVNTPRRIAEIMPTRSSLGLPETGFVFCAFNNTVKITPDIFTIWMRLLTQVGDSVLWLLEGFVGNETIRQNLRNEARKRDVDPERLIFAPRMSMEEHLARHRQADLFLDTLYYNAHTTASDALWAGLPIVTCLGNTFAGRVAASLLCAVGMPELVTRSHEEYESRALHLATDPAALATIRHQLEHNRHTFPLFNTSMFTQHIEAAFSAMVLRVQQGLAPDAIYIAP